MPNRSTIRTAEQRARQQLGFERLLDEQQHAIAAATDGKDVLVVMPTGSGKSAIYQLTGEMRDGPTVVVSPLLALQHDQLGNIAESGLSRAAALNSLLTDHAFARTLDDLARGEIEYLFVSPEQLVKADVVTRVRAAKPSLFVVDEAHCISAWGHDFRPEYLRLGDVARAVGRPPVLALTATAAPPVRGEIIDRLHMRDPIVVAGGFDRPEIDLRVDRFADVRSKRDAVVSAVQHRDGAGIVYVATRRNATEVAAALAGSGVSVAAYHGSLGRKQRHDVHERFLDGDTRVVVATNAFGMGIDKPDVRFVFHHDVPGSLDAYYQEIGRSGRDADDAEAILFYTADDLRLQKFFAGGSIDAASFAAVLQAAHRAELPVSAARLADDALVSKGRAVVAIDGLVRAGALTRDGRGRVTSVNDRDAARAVAAAIDAEEVRERVERSRLEMMRAYAETSWCRRALLLGYYGEEFRPPCGACDNCRAGLVDDVAHESPFAVGARVEHREWGDGTVMIVANGHMIVLFDEAGYRTLSTELVVARELLKASA